MGVSRAVGAVGLCVVRKEGVTENLIRFIHALWACGYMFRSPMPPSRAN